MFKYNVHQISGFRVAGITLMLLIEQQLYFIAYGALFLFDPRLNISSVKLIFSLTADCSI